jgi:hypothetical protein
MRLLQQLQSNAASVMLLWLLLTVAAAVAVINYWV